MEFREEEAQVADINGVTDGDVLFEDVPIGLQVEPRENHNWTVVEVVAIHRQEFAVQAQHPFQQ